MGRKAEKGSIRGHQRVRETRWDTRGMAILLLGFAALFVLATATANGNTANSLASSKIEASHSVSSTKITPSPNGNMLVLHSTHKITEEDYWKWLGRELSRGQRVQPPEWWIVAMQPIPAGDDSLKGVVTFQGRGAYSRYVLPVGATLTAGIATFLLFSLRSR